MSGYVEAGYVVILGTLSVYSVSLVTRERAARRRVNGRSVNERSVSAPAPEAGPTVPLDRGPAS